MTDNWIGQTLSKVQIQKLIGRGGMADVYLGTHTTLNVPRAVKILHGHLSTDPDLMRRFREEAKAVASMRHPYIVQVYDFDLLDGRPYIIMELLPGISLSSYLNGLHQLGTSLPLETVARILDGLADALEYAHAQGIVHRDIKPANVLLRQGATPISPDLPLPHDAKPVLTDFGIARFSSATSQTLTGTILGTPAYMSPEQVRGETVDARSDNYSLGIILYEMLAGSLPFDPEVDTTASVMYKQANVAPPPLANTSPFIQDVVDQALQKDKERRFQNAGELAASFRRALSPAAATVVHVPQRAAKARPGRPGWVLAAGLAVVGLGLAAVSLLVGVPWLLQRIAPAATTSVAATLPASPSPTVPSQLPTASLAPSPAPAVIKVGGAYIQDAALQAILPGLAAPRDDSAYGAWLRGRDASLLVEDARYAGGNLTISFVDPAGRNLLALYDSLLISLEPAPDPSPSVPGEILFQANPDETLLAEVRRLDELTRGAPISTSVIAGLRSQADTHDSHLGFAVTAGQSDNLAAIKQHSEHVINVLVGSASEEFGDYDGTSGIQNPGDGFGALPYLRLARLMVESEARDPGLTTENRSALETLTGQIDAAIAMAEDSLRLAKQITSADSAVEAKPLLARWDEMRLSGAVGAVARQLETDGIRLWLPVVTVP